MEYPPAMRGFSWIIDHRLAALPRPGRRGEGLAAIDRDLAFLASQEITLLVTLTVEPLAPERARLHRIEPLHIPVADFTAPTRDQLDTFVTAAHARIAADQAVAVHCHAGHGRTGTFAAAYLIHQGMKPGQAMAEIRRLRPGSIETEEQETCLRLFANRARPA